MIIGSGLIAQAFAPYFRDSDSVCVYAAGVSNSTCRDQREFDRESAALTGAVDKYPSADPFIYFGTCSAESPLAASSPYIVHKGRMEQIVRAHPRHLILRLPQVAGRSPNPHTLLNYLYARISRSERFTVWKNARRNIIDIDDVARIGAELAVHEMARGECINIANFHDISMRDLVALMAKIVAKPAICDWDCREDSYPINTDRIRETVGRCRISFDSGYIERVLRKYYEPVA